MRQYAKLQSNVQTTAMQVREVCIALCWRFTFSTAVAGRCVWERLTSAITDVRWLTALLTHRLFIDA